MPLTQEESNQIGEILKLTTEMHRDLHGSADVPGVIPRMSQMWKTLYGNGAPGLVNKVDMNAKILTWVTHSSTAVAAIILTALAEHYLR